MIRFLSKCDFSTSKNEKRHTENYIDRNDCDLNIFTSYSRSDFQDGVNIQVKFARRVIKDRSVKIYVTVSMSCAKPYESFSKIKADMWYHAIMDSYQI